MAPQQRQRRARRRAPRRRATFTTYELRHSFAAELRGAGTDVADMQDRPETTMVYAPPELRSTLRRPAAGWRTGSRWHGRLAEQYRCAVNYCKN